MVKKELVRSLSKKLPELQEKDVELALNCILNQITETLVKGKRIEIRGFGSFATHQLAPRFARNPKTGETVSLPAKAVIHFKPGKEIRDRIDASREIFVKV